MLKQFTNFSADRFTDSEGLLVSEASDLGFAPGLWPYSFQIDGKLFEHDRTERDAEQDITSAIYVAQDGTVAEVFND
jgi:hypothetical protein